MNFIKGSAVPDLLTRFGRDKRMNISDSLSAGDRGAHIHMEGGPKGVIIMTTEFSSHNGACEVTVMRERLHHHLRVIQQQLALPLARRLPKPVNRNF